MGAKPLNATQQRNMEILLADDLNNLQAAAYKALQAETRERLEKAESDWYAAHPEVTAVQAKIDAYLKRVNKRLRELGAELDEAGAPCPERMQRIIDEGGTFVANPFVLNTQMELQREKERINREHHQREQRLRQAMHELRQAKHREILLATLEASQTVLTLPSVEDFLKEIG